MLPRWQFKGVGITEGGFSIQQGLEGGSRGRGSTMKQVGGEGETNWFSWLFKRNQRNGGEGAFHWYPLES
jgi:hypothetical protein